MIRRILGVAFAVAGIGQIVLAEESADIQALLARQLLFEGKAEEAFAMAKPLAEAGGARAQSILGFLYERGLGVAADEALAVEWYRKAAEQGHPSGLHNLAYLYEEGELGVPQDLAKARELYAQAAAMDYPGSLHNLARMYLRGKGGLQDATIARALFERAVNLGSKEATADYAYILATGDGLPADPVRARQLYEIAAAHGIDWALRDYGEMLELGEGGPADLAGAEVYYRRAQALGNVDAGLDLAEMIWDHPETLPGREVEALAWCLWAETNGMAPETAGAPGFCAEATAALSAEDVAKAQQLAQTF